MVKLVYAGIALNGWHKSQVERGELSKQAQVLYKRAGDKAGIQ